jgi:hypothetical protein
MFELLQEAGWQTASDTNRADPQPDRKPTSDGAGSIGRGRGRAV